MAEKQVLLALADRCEREGPSRELDAAIWLATGGVSADAQAAWDAPIPLDQYALQSVDVHWGRHFTRNLAAAVSLVPMHQGRRWFWRVGSGSVFPGWAHLNKHHPDHCDRNDETSGNASTAEGALCAASLRARAAQPQGE
jgi:hypothetical protein